VYAGLLYWFLPALFCAVQCPPLACRRAANTLHSLHHQHNRVPDMEAMLRLNKDDHAVYEKVRRARAAARQPLCFCVRLLRCCPTMACAPASRRGIQCCVLPVSCLRLSGGDAVASACAFGSLRRMNARQALLNLHAKTTPTRRQLGIKREEAEISQRLSRCVRACGWAKGRGGVRGGQRRGLLRTLSASHPSSTNIDPRSLPRVSAPALAESLFPASATACLTLLDGAVC
jgi:hypothetical protein